MRVPFREVVLTTDAEPPVRIYVISIGCNFVGCQNFQFGRTIRFREKRPLLPEGRAGAGRGRRERRSPRCLAQRVDKQRFVPIGTRCYELGEMLVLGVKREEPKPCLDFGSGL